LAVDDGGEFPAEVEGIAYARVHSVSSGRDILMRRITRQEDAICRTMPGSSQTNMRSPHRTDQDLVDLEGVGLVRACERCVNHFSRVEFGVIRVEWDEHMGCPRVNFVLGDDDAAPVVFLVCEEGVPELAVLVYASEVAGFEVHEEGTGWATISLSVVCRY